MSYDLRVNTSLGFNGRGFELGLQKAAQSMTAFGKHVAGVLGVSFGIQQLKEWTQEVFRSAEEIENFSIRLGVTVEEIQRLKFIAEMSETSIEQLAKAFKFFAAAREKALTGKAENEAQKNFEQLGYTLDDLRKGGDPMKGLIDVFGKIASGKIGPEKLVPLIQVLGKGSEALIPMAKQFEELSKLFDQKVVPWTDKETKSLNEMKDALDVVGKRWHIFWGQVVLTAAGETPLTKEWKKVNAEQLQMLQWWNKPLPWQKPKMGAEIFPPIITGVDLFGDITPEMRGEKDPWTEALEAMEQEQDKAKTEKVKASRALVADSLARIGGFTGRGILSATDSTLNKIERNTRESAEALRRQRRGFATSTWAGGLWSSDF